MNNSMHIFVSVSASIALKENTDRVTVTKCALRQRGHIQSPLFSIAKVINNSNIIIFKLKVILYNNVIGSIIQLGAGC